jgi:hypothetical protein
VESDAVHDQIILGGILLALDLMDVFPLIFVLLDILLHS